MEKKLIVVGLAVVVVAAIVWYGGTAMRGRAKPKGIIVQPPATELRPGEQRSLTVKMSKPVEGLTVQWNVGKGRLQWGRPDGLVIRYTAPEEPGLDTITAEVWLGKKYLGMVSTSMNIVSQGQSGAQKETAAKTAEPPGEVEPRVLPLPPPSIEITVVPPVDCLPGSNSWGTIAGRVQGLENVEDHRVVVFAYGDMWYVQPWVASPYTSIAENGEWETGTHCGTEYAALLVRSSYEPPAITRTLSEVDRHVLAITKAKPRNESIVLPTVRTIGFSGYDWIVKSSKAQVGPGPNYFSDNTDNVWIDAQGRLHLRITPSKGHWYCAEVISKHSFGYGTYRFYLDSRTDNLDPNVVLGLFTWSDDPEYSHREIDIECARWGNANNSTNAQFVVQPYHPPGRLLRFQVPPGTSTSTHSFVWKKDSVFFQSLKGHYATPPEPSYVIKQWAFTGQSIPQAGGENARINLWLLGGRPPLDSKETEIIINKFEFEPTP